MVAGCQPLSITEQRTFAGAEQSHGCPELGRESSQHVHDVLAVKVFGSLHSPGFPAWRHRRWISVRPSAFPRVERLFCIPQWTDQIGDGRAQFLLLEHRDNVLGTEAFPFHGLILPL